MQEDDPEVDVDKAPIRSRDEGATERLEEWREAERDADHEGPGSAAETMARKRVDMARNQFHEAEDETRQRQGDDRPRKHDD